jgi:SAM-dependent methyltransferase
MNNYDQWRGSADHFWPRDFTFLPKYDPAALADFSCERSLAADSIDHLEPRGTANDNTHWVPFVVRCEEHFGGRDLRFLDLGCAGGGLVADFALRRHLAVGLEGSDYSKARGRAEWGRLPQHLHTCDITYPFAFAERTSGDPFRFDVISIWDALEHLDETRLPVVFENVRAHLAEGGLFVGTVSTRAAKASTGERNHHATVQPREWWERTFETEGFRPVEGVFAHEDYPRGNGVIFPADFKASPDTGFHFTLTAG